MTDNHDHALDQQPQQLEGKSLLQMVDMFPPWFVIALAKDHASGRALTYKEISERSGICLRTICRLAGEQSWAQHDIDVVSRVLDACGFGPDTWEDWKAYILRSIRRRRPFRHLHRRKRRLKKLIAMLQLAAGQHSAQPASATDQDPGQAETADSVAEEQQA
jgi:hypothetical protein